MMKTLYPPNVYQGFAWNGNDKPYFNVTQTVMRILKRNVWCTILSETIAKKRSRFTVNNYMENKYV